jgi:hypothetical protein
MDPKIFKAKRIDNGQWLEGVIEEVGDRVLMRLPEFKWNNAVYTFVERDTLEEVVLTHNKSG